MDSNLLNYWRIIENSLSKQQISNKVFANLLLPQGQILFQEVV